MTIRKPVVVVGSSNGSRNYGDDMMWLATARAVRSHAPEIPIVTDAATGWLPPIGSVTPLPFMHDSLLRYRMTVTRSRWANRAQGAVGLLLNRTALERGLARQDELAEGAKTTGIERRWEQEIAKSQALIFSGAGGLTDTFAVHAIAGWGMMVALARRHDVPTMMLGQGVGPLKAPELRASLTQTLQRCDSITTRDDLSTDLVRELAPGVPVATTIDWAVLERPSETVQQHVDGYLAEQGASTFVAASLHDWRPADSKTRSQATQLLEEICLTAQSQGMSVVLVPNMIGLGRADDRIFMRAAAAHLPHHLRGAIIDLPHDLTAFETRAVLSRARGVFSSRYHPVVFALAAGTPATGICYDDYYVQKHRGALSWYGESERVHRVGESHSREWWEAGIEPGRQNHTRRMSATERRRAECLAPLTDFLNRVALT